MPGAAVAAKAPHIQEQRRLRDRRDRKAQRLARRSSRCEHFKVIDLAARHRVWRATEVAICQAVREALLVAWQFAKQAFARSVKNQASDPREREGRVFEQ